MSCPCNLQAPPGADLSPVCLGHLWMFRHLTEEEQAHLAGSAIRRIFPRGGTVFHQNDLAGEMFLLKSGRVKLVKYLENGSEITLDIRQAGDFLGETMLADDDPYPVTAVCLEETLTCGFSRAVFESIVLRYPNIGLQVIRNMSRRISQLGDKVGTLASASIEERVLGILRQLAEQHGRVVKGGRMLQFALTHEELGFLCGAHRVTITRAIGELRAKGKVSENQGLLVLCDG